MSDILQIFKIYYSHIGKKSGPQREIDVVLKVGNLKSSLIKGKKWQQDSEG